MSLALYSCKSKTATKLKDKGIEISVDDENDDTINVIHDDGKVVKFNCVYNKEEIKEMIKKITGAPSNFNIYSLITEGKSMYALNYEDKKYVLEKTEKLVENYEELYNNVNSSLEEIQKYVKEMFNQQKVSELKYDESKHELNENTENVVNNFTEMYNTLNTSINNLKIYTDNIVDNLFKNEETKNNFLKNIIGILGLTSFVEFVFLKISLNTAGEALSVSENANKKIAVTDLTLESLILFSHDQINNNAAQISNIASAHNRLVSRVDKIKSCDCDHSINNIYRDLFTSLYDQVGALEQTVAQHDLNRMEFENTTQLFRSEPVSIQFYNDHTTIQHLYGTVSNTASNVKTRLMPDRFQELGIDHYFKLNTSDWFVWNIQRAWWRDATLYRFPEGWRTNRAFVAPNNMVWDEDRGQWIEIANPGDEFWGTPMDNWRTTNNSEDIRVQYVISTIQLEGNQEIGHIHWDRDMWVYREFHGPRSAHILEGEFQVVIPGADTDIESWKLAQTVAGDEFIEPPADFTFEESKPIYGNINIKANLIVNGLINGVDINVQNNTLSQLTDIEDRLKVLEAKTKNIKGPEIPTGELTLENLLKSYDERIKVLETKCANIDV